MAIETFDNWQLERAYLDWKLEQFKPEPLEALTLGEPEIYPYEPLESL